MIVDTNSKCYLYFLIQVSSTFVLQGLRMDLSVGNFTIPVASLALFNSIMLIILIPFLQKVVYPILNKCHIRPTSLQRLGKYLIRQCLYLIRSWHYIYTSQNKCNQLNKAICLTCFLQYDQLQLCVIIHCEFTLCCCTY